MDAAIKNSPLTYKGLLIQFRMQKAVEIIKKSEINIVTGKVYFDGQEVSGIYKFALDAFNELSLATDQASKNLSELGNISFEFGLKDFEVKRIKNNENTRA